MRASAIALVASSLLACTFSGAGKLGATSGHSEATRVVVLARDDPGRPYTVVGVVSAEVDGEDPEGLRDELADAASSLGADAVVGVEIHFSQGSWNAALRASGTAVKYR